MHNLLVTIILEALYRESFAASVVFADLLGEPKAREAFVNDRGVMAVARDLKVPGHYPSLPENGGSLLQRQGAGWIDPAY